MKFHRLVLQSLALLALSSPGWDRYNTGMVALAEDVDDEEVKTTEENIPDEYVPPENAENFAFQAEVHRMLDIVVNSLYQNNDVFLRELISNASDALDKFHFMSLTDPDTYKAGDIKLEVKIEFDEDAGTMTIRDTGIGMTRDDMVKNLGTVAHSGTTKFLEMMKDQGKKDVNQIGQFGVGFYSAFLVANRITVASKHPSSEEQYVWESVNGEPEFHVYPDPRGETLGRGTEITLHLKEDAKEYANEMKAIELAKHYSEFVVHPIYVRTSQIQEVEDDDEEADDLDEAAETEESEDGELEEEEEEKPKETITVYSWEQVNTDKAIWTRDKDEITDEEYQNFWKVCSKDDSEAAAWVHFNAEGNINFKSILYAPDEIPSHLQRGSLDESVNGIRLYVRKVLINDAFELLPRYLSFVRGVVDSDDLPLNVNRETLQESKIIKVIRKKLIRKSIDMIRDFSKRSGYDEDSETEEVEVDADGNIMEADEEGKEPEYITWYKKFAPSLKLGILEDDANQSKLVKLLRFQTSKSDDKWISIEEYLERKKDWQDEIYVHTGVSKEELSKSPFMEPFYEKDVEVLYMTDPIDEYLLQRVRDFDDAKLVQISKENVKFKDEDQDLVKRREKAYKNQFKPLTKWMKKLYGQSVMRITVSGRLGTSPAIVSSGEYGTSANMDRILKANALNHGATSFGSQAMKIMEINPRHPLILKMLEGAAPEGSDEDDDFTPTDEIIDAAWILHDMAMLNGGFPITDPVEHSKRMVGFMQSSLGVESLDLVPEINPPEEEEEAPDLDDFDLGGMGGMNMEDFDLDSLDLD